MKKKENKNTKIDSLGQKRGRLYTDKQNIEVINLKKIKVFIKNIEIKKNN